MWGYVLIGFAGGVLVCALAYVVAAIALSRFEFVRVANDDIA